MPRITPKPALAHQVAHQIRARISPASPAATVCRSSAARCATPVMHRRPKGWRWCGLQRVLQARSRV